MCHFEFAIPHKREDLLNSPPHFYSVREVFCIDEVKQSFEQCVNWFNSEGCEFILDQFDYLYSLLDSFTQYDWPFISKYSRIIDKSITRLPAYVHLVLGNELDTDVQLKARNTVLMNLYIVTQFVTCAEDRVREENASGKMNKSLSQASKRRKVKSPLDEFVSQWESSLCFWFAALIELLQSNLCKLWTSNLINSACLNVCANCCYKVLEKPSFSHARLKPLRDTVYQVLGTLIKKYQHGNNCSGKIVQLLFLYNHTAMSLAQAVVLFVLEFECTSLIVEIIKEIELTLPAHDTMKNKSVSAFIMEIATSNPRVISVVVNDLICYLDREPYSIMRRCTLTVIAEVLLMYSKQGDLNEETREQRQQYFTLLERHIMDNNSFVRCKVLQLWLKLVEAKSVPNNIVSSVLNRSLKRVADKNSVVSKNAVRLVTKIFEMHSSLIQVADAEHIVDTMVQLLCEMEHCDISDITHFLMVSYQHNLPGAERGITEMLKLVFAAAEKSAVNAVTDVYSKLYLTASLAVNKSDRINQIVAQLCSCVRSLTNVYQCKAMSEIVSSWVKNKRIDIKCIKAIWEVVKSGNSDTKQTALLLVFMIGSASQNVMKSCMNDLIIYGLMQDPDTGEIQLQTVLFTCRALGALQNEEESRRKYSADHVVFTELISVVKEHFLITTSPVYLLVTKAVVDLIFQLCKTPQVLSEQLLLDLYHILTSSSETTEPESDTTFVETDTACVAHFITLLGYTAYRVLRYYENDFLEALKKRNRETMVLLNPNIQFDTDAAADADEAAIESVRKITEICILDGAKSNFGKLSKMVVNICCKPVNYGDSRLFVAAAVTLSQLMLISSSFCHRHMQLLVALTERTKQEEIRSWMVVAMGDMLTRFPNTVKPWMPHLFSRLRDNSEMVRRVTLNTLYHLITNEILKVKGQISQVALCIIDPVKEISGLARKLLMELSKKDNLLYNVFSDIVSHLSNPDSGMPLTEEQFQTIMKFLIDQIHKERYVESIVEKICKRMLASVAECQWKNLAFCLSQLSWTEHSLYRLLENANCFVDKLTCPAVAEVFSNIADTCGMSTKPAVKAVAIELNCLIEEVLNRGLQTEGDPDCGQQPHCNSLLKRRTSVMPFKKSAKTPSKTPKNQSVTKATPKSARKSTLTRKSGQKRKQSVQEMDTSESENEILDNIDPDVSSVASLKKGTSQNVTENSCKSKRSGARKRILFDSRQ